MLDIVNQFTFASPWFYATICFVVASVCGTIAAIKVEQAKNPPNQG